ncbi:CRACD-like protein [Brachionichthys hirsutus]|uniref:CRACD-like protein n=1 Tax=Brachionichthys hirsutus TaxID=412623 RepID=UPI0036049D8D
MAGMYGCFKSRTDCAAMASGPPDVMGSPESTEVVDESQAKKKSKFQTFKKFFTRKKRKDPPVPGDDGGLKASQSSDDVSKAPENNKLARSEEKKKESAGSKISLGSKALSHDSVFVSDSSDANEALGASQDSIHGKVKSLQLQLKQAIRLGSPPSLMCVKGADDAGAMSEDDGLPCSPPEYSATSKAQGNSAISLEGLDGDEDQLSCAASGRAMSPLVVPGDFSQPASPFGCLDNAAARHKLDLRSKACHKRKPVSRLEMKPQEESKVETKLETSTTEALEERRQSAGGDEDEITTREEREEEEEVNEEEEEEGEKEPRHSRESLPRDEDEEDEDQDGSEAEQDVIHSPDSSSPPKLCLSEEEAPDSQAPPSSKPRSTASSLDSPRASPEPPSSPKEHLLHPPAAAQENRDGSDLGEEKSGKENEIQENREEESSLLQEVLSSLKTPLVSSSLAMEPDASVQEIEEEVMEKEREAVEVEEREVVEEVKGEKAETGERLSYQAAPADSLQSKEEEEEIDTSCTSACQNGEEVEEANDEEEEASEEEEKGAAGQSSEHGQKDEEKDEIKLEEQKDSPTENAVSQAEEEGKEEEREEEEEVLVLEKEPELGEEEEEHEDEEVEEVKESVEEAEQVIDGHGNDAEEMMEVLPGAANEEEESLQEEDEGVDVADDDDSDTQESPNDDDDDDDDDEISAEDEAVVGATLESQEASSQSFREEREDGGEELEEDEDEDIGRMVSDQGEEEEEDASQPDEDQTEAVEPKEEEEMSHTDMKPVGTDQTGAVEEDVSRPAPLSLPESHQETQTQEDGTVSPSRTGTTTLHINLISPSSEKATPFFQQSPNQRETPSQAGPTTEPNAASAEEGPAEEDEQSSLGEGTPPPAAEETDSQQSSPPDQSQVCVGAAASSPSLLTAPAPDGRDADASRESCVRADGTPDSVFGVRLRKTSVLRHFSLEEDSPEPPMEPPARPSSCKGDSPQPISVKPAISQPISSKPALPKKPDLHGDNSGKAKRISDVLAACGASDGPGSPSWISVAKQKQQIYKENAPEEMTGRKEEQEKKSPLPMYVSSAVSREQSSKSAESTSKGILLDTSKPSVSVEKETQRVLSPTTPVPFQPPKSQPLPSPVSPKPLERQGWVPQPIPPRRSLPPPSPAPLAQKSPSFTSPQSLSKIAASSKTPEPHSTRVTSPPSPSRAAPEKSGSKAPGLSRQTPPSQKGPSPQDEPPWMALAKKKAKAWSEMPQIVQ